MGVDAMFFSKVVALADKHFKPGKATLTISQMEQIRFGCELIQEAVEESMQDRTKPKPPIPVPKERLAKTEEQKSETMKWFEGLTGEGE